MTVGSYEAKTHLSGLLERVALGERITITRHGVPIAMLVPVSHGQEQPVVPLEVMMAFRRGRTLKRREVRKMMKEGRRS